VLDCAFASQLAVKLCRARIAALEAAIAEAKAAGAETSAAAAEKEIGGLEDSLDGELGCTPCIIRLLLGMDPNEAVRHFPP